jgi:glycosyltransferase involved in cell wall biosynthesis
MAWPRIPIVFCVQDLHYLREYRKAMQFQDPNALRYAEFLFAKEIEMVKLSSCTIVVSDFERTMLQKYAPHKQIFHIPLIYRTNRSTKYFHSKKILFVGGFNHHPNVDAVVRFHSEVWPLLVEQDNEISISIVGSNVTSEVLKLDDGGNFKVVGYVEDIAKAYSEATIFVAPLKYGAGVKGKVIEALAHGIPGVISNIAAEGTSLSESGAVLIRESPVETAAAILKLLSDERLVMAMREKAFNYVDENHSHEVARRIIQEMIGDIVNVD